MKSDSLNCLLRDPSGWSTRLTVSMMKHYRETGNWRDQTIADQLEALCVKRPEQKLIVEAGGLHTAQDLRRDALGLAGALKRRGVNRGDVVSFQLPNWYEAVVVELACAFAGFVCNPIVPIYRNAEVDFIIRNSGSRALFIPERFRNFDYRAMVAELRPGWEPMMDVIVVRPSGPSASSFESLMREEPVELGPRPDPNHVKLLMYTSGTTSQAKGVLHTHNTIAAEIGNFIDWLKFDENDVVLMPSPLAHITGYLYGIQLPITLGCPVVLMETWDVAKAADLIEANNVTFTLGATPFLQELTNFCKETQRRLPSLRYFPCGGAPVPPEIVLAADAVFDRCVAFRVYGSTEAPTVTLGVPDRANPAARARTDGYIVGHEVRLVDDSGREVSPGEEGEITTRGPELMIGYVLAEDNDGAFDRDGFFHTGDLAVQTPEGCLTITGRKKDIIIRGGENLSPKEIEDVLYTHPAIREAAVVAMPHPRLGETCCAFVTLRSGAAFDFEAMQDVLRASGLAKQKYPERLEVVADLPYTAAGKIRKNLCAPRFLKESAKKMPEIKTRTATKRTREQQTRATREALMKAALRVVSQHGYAKASVSRITEAAGVAQGTFYSYFDTHQQLLAELLPAEGVQLLDALGRDAQRSDDYFEHERRMFHSFFAYMRRNPYFLRVLTEAEIAAPESHAQHMSNIEDRYVVALRRAQMQGQIRSQSDMAFRVIAEILSGSRGHIAIGLSQQAGNKKSKLPPDWAADTYVKFIRFGFGETALAKSSFSIKPARGRAPVPKKASDTRTLLLQAAARLVHDHGYQATTIARITQAANVAVGTFYGHFRSRQRLLDEILAHVRTEMLDYVREVTRGSNSFLELEQRGFIGFFDYLAKNPWYIRIETEAALWAPESYVRHFTDLTARYVAAMRRSKMQGQLRAYEDHELPMLAFISMAARHYLSTRYVLSSTGSGRLPAPISRVYLDLIRYGLQR